MLSDACRLSYHLLKIKKALLIPKAFVSVKNLHFFRLVEKLTLKSPRSTLSELGSIPDSDALRLSRKLSTD